MNRRDRKALISEIKKQVSLYRDFISPDYPELNIFANQYLDVLIKYYDDIDEPYSVVYSDINKLSVVNDNYGKDVGDQTLYTLLDIFSSCLKKPHTVRVGGDEFITFVRGTKEEIKEKLRIVDMTSIRGSSIAYAVEDSSSGNAEALIKATELQVTEQKQHRGKDAFLTQASLSEGFVDLLIPDNISDAQKKKWEILNNKINSLVDNHLRDIRPSNPRFEYTIDHIRKDAKSFVSAFAKLITSTTVNQPQEKIGEDDLISPYDSMTSKSAHIMHHLFKGDSINFRKLSDDELTNLKDSIDTLGNSIIKNKHSGLLDKTYYIKFLADKLLKSGQTFQAVYYSMSGLRPTNTAYGHLVGNIKIEKTSGLFTNSITSRRTFNNEPFSFNKNNNFLIDHGGGDFLAIICDSEKLSDSENEQILDEINSQSTEDAASSLKMASAIKNNVNRKTIPYFVNSMPGNELNRDELSIRQRITFLYLALKNRVKKVRLLNPASIVSQIRKDKPFVLLSKRLKEDCNNNKDAIKVENLDKQICEDSITAIAQDCVSYFLENIEGADSINTQKFLLNNVMLALSNHEEYANSMNRQRLEKQINDRTIFKPEQNKQPKIDER